jgi:hypothetical protein
VTKSQARLYSTIMNSNYWIDTVEKLKHVDTASEAARLLSFDLGRGIALDKTGLGMALSCVPSEEVILGTLLAYADPSARPFCDRILWYFEPDEVLSVYRALPAADRDVRNALKHFLKDIESSLADEV